MQPNQKLLTIQQTQITSLNGLSISQFIWQCWKAGLTPGHPPSQCQLPPDYRHLCRQPGVESSSRLPDHHLSHKATFCQSFLSTCFSHDYYFQIIYLLFSPIRRKITCLFIPRGKAERKQNSIMTLTHKNYYIPGEANNCSFLWFDSHVASALEIMKETAVNSSN